MQALSNANVSLYPIDARGLVGPNDIIPGFTAVTRGSPFSPEMVSTGFQKFALTLQAMQTLADRTGGRAFYDTSDITHSLRQALDDSTVQYILGFYPRENEWNSTFHNPDVKVKRPGVEVRHRAGFYALPEPRMTAQGREARALEAAKAPLEATQMRLTVHLAEFASGNAPLRFDLVVDPGRSHWRLVTAAGRARCTLRYFNARSPAKSCGPSRKG